MKTLEKLEKKLKKQKKEFRNNIFKFIQNTDIDGITNWSIYEGFYNISIVKNDIKATIIAKADDYYETYFSQNDYCLFKLRLTDDNKDFFSYELSVIKEKISQANILEENKKEEKEKREIQERFRYYSKEIAKLQMLNQLFD